MFVDLEVGEHASATVDRLRDRILAIDAVVARHLVSGGADHRLEVVVPSLEAYGRLLIRELLDLPGVVDVHSTFAIRTVKEPGNLSSGHLRQEAARRGSGGEPPFATGTPAPAPRTASAERAPAPEVIGR